MKNLDPIRGNKFKLLLVLLPVVLAIISSGCSETPMTNNMSANANKTAPNANVLSSPVPTGTPNCQNVEPGNDEKTTFFNCPRNEKITFKFENTEPNTVVNFGVVKPPTLVKPTTLERAVNNELLITIEADQHVFIEPTFPGTGITRIKISDSLGRVFFECTGPDRNIPDTCFIRASAVGENFMMFQFNAK